MALFRALCTLSSSSSAFRLNASAGAGALMPSVEPLAAAVGSRIHSALGNTGQARHMSDAKRELFVAWEIEDEALKEVAAAFGEVEAARSAKSRGYGFVVFASEEEAQRAAEAMIGRTLEGQVITVEHAGRDAKAKTE